MVSFFWLIAAAATVTGVIATPVNVMEEFELVPRSETPSSTGTSDGYYFSWGTDGASSDTYANGGGGQNTLTWSGGNGYPLWWKGMDPMKSGT
ncbi:hypothetical protein MPER_07645, partial [Moniliophthora perniciosa FA553]